MKTGLYIAMWTLVAVSLGFIAKIATLVPAVLSIGCAACVVLAGLCFLAIESIEELERPSDE